MYMQLEVWRGYKFHPIEQRFVLSTIRGKKWITH